MTPELLFNLMCVLVMCLFGYVAGATNTNSNSHALMFRNGLLVGGLYGGSAALVVFVLI